jgi:LacI family transcriptional regulator
LAVRKNLDLGSRPAISLKVVATLAKCSASAAGAVLNGVDNNTRVSDQTRKRIQAAAKKLGYRCNYLARALRTGRSQMLGVMTGGEDPAELHVGFWGALIGGIERAARDRGSDLLLIGAHATENEFDRSIRLLAERKIDALAIPSLFYSHRLDDIGRIAGAVAIAFSLYPVRNHPQVGIAIQAAVREAVHHLAGLGHREVAWLGYRADGQPAEPLREQAFRAAIVELSLASRMDHLDALAGRAGSDALVSHCAEQYGRILDRDGPPSALIAYNELMGMGVYRALRARGFRVPEDVSVIGFDDIHARLADPPMTVISLQLDVLGYEVGSLALRMAEDPELIPQLANAKSSIEARLVTRASTATRRS